MDEKFNSILSIAIIPQIIDLIQKNSHLDDANALNAFYQSETYKLLSDEQTKLWHYSPLTLYNIWKHEQDCGEIIYPEEWVMSKELPFIVLCVEEYKNQKNMTGKEVLYLFMKYSVLDYIKSFYEVLHTTGTKYIVEDIDLYIKSCQIA